MARKSIFQHSALISNLITQEQLDDALQALRHSQRDSKASGEVEVLDVEVSDEQLASQLVYNGVISEYQAEQLKSADELRRKALSTDVFSPDSLAKQSPRTAEEAA